jgi:uncharacterized membrane protein
MPVLRRHSHPSKDHGSDTQRLEAFSDGVFAIAITLLILEIHPQLVSLKETTPHLSAKLIALWPNIAVYMLSFINIGIYWANHNHIFRLYKRTDHVFLLLNVLFLMCVSFVPLPTAVLGEYVLNPLERKPAIIFYSFGLFLPAFTWWLSWLYASLNYRLIDERLAPKYVRFTSWLYGGSNFVYLIAMAVALRHPTIGLAITAGFTCLYLFPPKRPIYRRGVNELKMSED